MAELEGAKLEQRVAQKVFKWRTSIYADWCRVSKDGSRGDGCFEIWEPLKNMSHAFQIVDAMAAKGYKYSLIGDSEGVTARFTIERDMHADVYSGYAPAGSPGEAICKAALAAVKEATQ